MALCRTNYSYLTNFGFAPHFKNVSETKIHILPSYDENVSNYVDFKVIFSCSMH